MEDHGETVIMTQLDESKTQFNFGPVSLRDSIVYTCERPGGDPTEPGTVLTPSKVLPEWIEYIRNKHGITNVIVLLSHEELKAYGEDGLLQAYRNNEMNAFHIPYSSENSAGRILNVLRDIKSKNGKVTVHCTHGMGRSGCVAALWLHQEYELQSEDAINETLETARKYGVQRIGSMQQVNEWIATMK